MLLPYSTDRPPKNPPLAVVSLVLIHFAVYGLVALILAVRGTDAAVLWYANLSLVPGSIQPHALLTYAFIHDSIFHLSGNMLFLWVFGGSVEDAIGWKRFLVLYATGIVLSGVLEVLMAALLVRTGSVTPIVGASGAISAVVGVFAFRFYRSSIGFIGLPFRVPAVVLLAGIMLLEMSVAIFHLARREQAFLSQAAAHWAHIGGFLFGILWARLARAAGSGRAEYLEVDARRAMDLKSYPAAAHRWEELLKLQPDNLDARAELACALSEMGESESAQDSFQIAMNGLLKSGRKSDSAVLYARLGDLAASLALTPQEMLAISGALEERGETRLAGAALERILSSYPKSAEAETARLRLAAIHLKAGDRERAADLAQETLRLNPHTDLRSFAQDLLRRAGRSEGSDG